MSDQEEPAPDRSHVSRHSAPKVRQEKIPQLYETEARGIVDEELIDDVGYTLLLRCRTIWIVTDKRCPLCTAILEITGEYKNDRVATCPDSDWTVRWRVYQRSYKGGRIHGGRVYPMFISFMEQFPKAKIPKAKLLLIDRVIHALYEDMSNVYSVPDALNLILGKHEEILELLDDLAYGDNVDPSMKSGKETWRQKITESQVVTAKHHKDRGE